MTVVGVRNLTSLDELPDDFPRVYYMLRGRDVGHVVVCEEKPLRTKPAQHYRAIVLPEPSESFPHQDRARCRALELAEQFGVEIVYAVGYP